MARLQRKKPSTGKKKKGRTDEASGSETIVNGSGTQATAVAEMARPAKKPQSVVSRRTPAGSRSEPGKIRATIDKSLQFLREVRIELKKVTWPSRKQTMGSTVVVLVLVMIISLFLGIADIGLSSLIRAVLQ